MKKLICLMTIGLTTFSASAQLVWQKGGNNALPAGSAPTLGTTYNAPLGFLTNNVQRATLFGNNPPAPPVWYSPLPFGGLSYAGYLLEIYIILVLSVKDRILI